MDIEQVWKGHQAETVGLPGMQNISRLKPNHQKNPLKRMKRLLVINMLWAMLCVGLYIAIIYFFSFWEIRVLIGITLAFTIWAIASALQLYRSVNDHVLATNLLAELKRNHSALATWMKIQNRVALCIYPFSISGGYIWGGVMGSGKTVSVFMSKPVVWWALIICIVIMTPLAYKLGKWMFKKSFGKVMIQLEENMISLSADIF